ncbi:hypothetical protein SLS60_011275 [Paraconiothyrium brasiliense]|uniref:Uncharacterized protein n=1 Tax=Paraconiothyrium brasiliense TaxID=300254 RepID=A0ABR3QL94_9PLEO
MEGIEASHPTAVQDYELQLRLERQNKSDPFAFTQEKDQLWEGSWLQAYQNRLMLLQQKNKQRLMKRKETDQESRREVKSQDQLIQSLLLDQETMKRMLAGREQEEQKKAGGLGNHLEALKLEEQQDTKRRSNTEDEEKLPAPPANTNPQDYAMQLRSVEPQKMELRQEPRPKQEPWQNTRPSVEPNGVPVKVESQQPRELQTQGHPAMGRGEQSKPSRMTLEHSEMQFHYLTEAHKQTSTEPIWKPGNLQSEWKGIISKPTNEYSQRMDWEEILPGDVESPPSTPCMTPPESLSPTLPDPGADCAGARHDEL